MYIPIKSDLADFQVSSSPDGHLDHTRSLALQSSLRSAKTKLGDKREAIQTLTRAKEELERTNQILAAAAKNSAIQLRITQQENAELRAKAEHWEMRNNKLMGEYLRLEEDHTVLKTMNNQDLVS